MVAFQSVAQQKVPGTPAIGIAEQPAIEIRDLCVRYDSGVALEGVSCGIPTGSRVAIVGPNGAGKSTLLKAIVGLQKPNSGSIKLSGAVAYVPQRSQVDWRFPVTVADVVMMGRVGHLGFFRRPRRADRERVHEALKLVRLESLANRQIGQLSGGQQQRMFLARALTQEARILLLDEPLNGLDVAAQDDLFQILDHLCRQGVTALTAMHDLQLAARHFDRAILLNRRMVGFGSAAEIFTPARLIETYGSHLHLSLTRDGLLTVADTCCDGDHS
ncbi:MAG: metal ABC transporter ATP-binding protein [Oscillochloris sp.]|nr:metal ABC transporter ATP-binding protein [Oscillochloris sp.]